MTVNKQTEEKCFHDARLVPKMKTICRFALCIHRIRLHLAIPLFSQRCVRLRVNNRFVVLIQTRLVHSVVLLEQLR